MKEGQRGAGVAQAEAAEAQIHEVELAEGCLTETLDGVGSKEGIRAAWEGEVEEDFHLPS